MTMQICDILRGLCLAGLAAGTAAASPYDGLYRPGSGSDCGRVGEEGGVLRIEDDLFEGIGSQCRMTRPVDVVDMEATLYTMRCEAGDMQWSERAMLMRAADGEGLIMLWDGYAFRYAPCPPPGSVAAAAAQAPRVVLPLVVLPGTEQPLVIAPAGDGPATPAAGGAAGSEAELDPGEEAG
ncbi:hypothetical protein [Limimaricola pyoseonensis]|uniref:Uncharacterized protein n=1 Tax=Limimaricola pyoseonensis TaxID=521013 RepID=A0A1G7F3R4_9RHOB|nr:hypothetical protein [Limimaricola pyoseonensis]SDE70492.1 hypothetical protein SAMN04488567_2410 [Limimaricola pyoseonensis]